MLINVLLVIHILAALAIIVLVLMQHGKGADMGAAFGGGGGGGGGGSNSLFGAQGSANFLSRLTAILATVFFIVSLGLAYMYTQNSPSSSVTNSVIQTEGSASGSTSEQSSTETGTETEKTSSGDSSVPEVPVESKPAAEGTGTEGSTNSSSN